MQVWGEVGVVGCPRRLEFELDRGFWFGDVAEVGRCRLSDCVVGGMVCGGALVKGIY